MLMETRIISIQLDQLVMLAFLDDLSLLDHQNPVRGPHGAQPISDGILTAKTVFFISIPPRQYI